MTPIRKPTAQKRSFAHLAIAAGWAVSLCLAVTVFCGSAAAGQAGNAAETVFAKVSPSVVIIIVKDASGKPALQGSGVVIAISRLITNCHVAQGGPSIEVHSGDKKFSATILYADPDRDLCELSVPGLAAPAVTVSPVKNLKIGQQTFAVGAPEGLDLTISDGIVSSLRHVEGSFVIQTTAAISPGSSGGGLFDAEGNLVGITSYQFAEGQNLNFALPVDWIASLPSRSQAEVDYLADKQELSFIFSASALETSKDWRRLAQFSLQRTRSHPSDDIAWSCLGEAYDELGQENRAAVSYKQALQLDPKDEIAWVNLGAVYNSLEQFADGIEAEKEALRLRPDDHDAWGDLGNAYRGIGQHENALAAYKQALQLNPDDADIWVNLGVAYDDLGQYEKEVSAEKRAIQIKPTDEEAWVNVGNAYDGLGQHDNAIASYAQAIRIRPDDADAWADIGNAYDSLGHHDKAIASYKEALDLKPGNAVAWVDLGLAYDRLRQYSEAVAAFRQALRFRANDENAWLDLGLSYCGLADRNSAISAYKALQKLNPDKARKLFETCIVP